VYKVNACFVSVSVRLSHILSPKLLDVFPLNSVLEEHIDLYKLSGGINFVSRQCVVTVTVGCVKVTELYRFSEMSAFYKKTHDIIFLDRLSI
jgi:hypothetical protein